MQVIFPRRLLRLAVLVFGLALGAILAGVYLPKASITIHPARQEQTVAQDITLSSTAGEPNFAQYILPAKNISASASEEKTFEREGATVTEEFAKGEVTLVNTRDEVQELLPKTHLRHEASGVFFLTDFPVAIPAKGSVHMTVTAKEKGAPGNVPTGKFIIDKLPTDLQSDVYAESATAFTGGMVVETPISEGEITQAKEEVKHTAFARARGELTAQAGGASIFDGLVNLSVAEETVSAQAGSRAQTFTVKIAARARAFIVNENDLLSLTLLALRSKPKADQEFVSYRPESFEVKIIQADFERGEARVAGMLTGTFASKIGPNVLVPAPLAGLSAQEVKAYFKDNPAVGAVDVALSPFWVRSVPGRKGAVQMTVENTLAR